MEPENKPSDGPNLDDAIFAGASAYDELDDGPRPDTSDKLPVEDDKAPAGDESKTEQDDADDETTGDESADDQEGEEADAEGDEADLETATDAEGEADKDEQPQSDDSKSKEPRIPKSRFDEVNERRKAAENRLAEIEKQRQADGKESKIDFDFNAKEDAYMDAVLDGDKDKARAIRQEIREAETQLYQQQMQETSTNTREATKAELELQSTIDGLQTQYPVFDGQSDQYDQNLTEEALDLFEGFKGRGYDPATAMRRAVRYVVRANDLDESATAAEPEPEPKPTSQHKAKPEQGKRKVKQAAKQPPEPSSRDVSEAPDPMNMSEEEFDKLSDQELAKLRGDIT